MKALHTTSRKGMSLKNDFPFFRNGPAGLPDGRRPEGEFRASTIRHSCHPAPEPAKTAAAPAVERRGQVGGPETQTGQARLLDYMENAIILADIREKGPYFAAGNCSLDEVLQAAHQRAVKFAGFYKVKIGPLPRGLGTVVGDGFFLEKALFCLLRTAIMFSHDNGEVRLQAPSLHAEACLTIEADGFSVPEDILPRFFEMLAFPQSDTPLDDLGLAPVVADRIISPLGGVVAVSRIHPAGTRFHIVLPRPSQASSAPAAADHDAA